jgi:flagellar export protein FliJ
VKPFRFQFARLARVRRVQEELARGHWLGAELAARRLGQRLAQAEQELAAALDHLRTSQGRTSLDPREVLDVREMIGLMESGRQRLRQRARAARGAAERARAPWQSLRTELEGLLRLEQKARVTHRLETEREDARETDQVAGDRGRRQSPFQRTTP